MDEVSARRGVLGPLAVFSVFLFATGCHSSFRMDVTQLYRLGYFEEGEEVRLRDLEGREVPFTSSTPLTLVLKNRTVIEDAFQEIQCDAESYEGKTSDGHRVSVDLWDISDVYVYSREIKPRPRAERYAGSLPTWGWIFYGDEDWSDPQMAMHALVMTLVGIALLAGSLWLVVVTGGVL